MSKPSASDLTDNPPAVDPIGVGRFRDDVAALAITPAPHTPLALAVSGGADSMAMLVLAHAAFPDAIVAATVDHGLRPAGRDEAHMVATWCAASGIAHAILTPDDTPGAGENLHVWARGVRYRLLAEWTRRTDATALATAHHADDQAETFLMRAGRGAGLSGLAGVRPRLDAATDGFPLVTIRPLLGWRRANLRRIAAAAGAPFVDDPSNDDPRFDRTIVRRWLAEPGAPDSGQLARAALQLGVIDADLRAWAEKLWCERTRTPDGNVVRLDVTGLPRTIRRYLAATALERLGQEIGASAVERNIEPLLDALNTDSAATQGGVMASAKGAIWTFRPAPPRRTG